MKTLSLLLTAALWAGAAAAATIDDFDVNQPPLTAPASASASATQDGPVANLLGGERDLRLTESTATGTIAADVSKGVFSFSAGPGASGTWGLSYDGNDNDADTLAFGLGANLTTGGDNAFLLGLNSLTGSPTITLEVFSSATDWSTFTLANPALLPTQVRIPFSAFTVGGGAGANFASAGAIQVKLSGTAVGGQIDFLRTGSATGPTPVEATLTDVLLVDNDNNGKASPGDTLRYVVRIANTSVITRIGVQYAAPAVANASAPANLQASPLARDEGAVGSSVPGNPFHTPFNTTLTVNNGDPDEDLLNNDYLGAPAAVITKFGGGTFGGTVDSQNAGATATSGGHSLTVNADGSFTYAPPAGFTGPVTFEYRLANASGSDTATVTLAVGVRPSAFADAHGVTGNVQIDSSTGTPFSVLDNDTGDNLTITPGAAGLGTVSVSPNGQFTYTPPRGKATGTDSFTYTIANGFGSSGPVTVTLNFANIVWFIDGSAGAGDGRSASPYNTLAAFNAVNNGAVNNPANNEVIILRDGTYDNNVAGGALVLRDGQRVFGDGWSGTFNAAAGFSLAEHSVVAPFSGTDPVIQNTTGSGIRLASGNQLRGLTAGNTPNDYGYLGSAVGNLTIAECSKTGTGGAIAISTSGAFGANVSFDTLESTSAVGANLYLTGVTGTLGVTAGGSGFAGSGGPQAVLIDGGSVSLTYPGNISKVSGIQALVYVIGGHTGTLTFSGTLSATAGTGLQFDNADGTYNFNGPVTLSGGDAGIDIVNGSAGNFTFANANITNPSGAAFLVNGGNGTISQTGTITKNNAGRLVDIQSRTGGSVTLAGNLSSTGTSTGINVANCTGMTLTFSGTTKTLNTGANAAVSLTSNSGATINFSGGGLDIDTSTGTGFSATGGGTVNVTGNNNTITTTAGAAINVANTTIGTSDLNFRSISSVNAAADAVALNNTGTAGGLKVGAELPGTPVAGDGGTITNPGDNALSLVNTANAFFRGLLINGTGGHGILGTGMSDGSGGAEATLELRNCRLTSPGNADNESGLYFGTIASPGNNTGSIVLTDVIVEQFEDQGFEAVNNAGSLIISITGTPTGLTTSTTKFDDNNDTHGTSGILVVSTGTASMTVNVTGVYFNNVEAEAIMLQSTAATSSLDANLLNNISINGGGPDNFPSGGGFAIVQDANGSATFDIKGNTIRDLQGDCVVIIADGPSQGRIGGPLVSDGNVLSGSLVGDGIRIDTDQLPGNGNNFTATILIQNNQIGSDATFPGIGDDGIQILHRDGTKTLNLTIANNTIANTVSEALRYFQDADVSDGALKPYGAVRVANNTMSNIGTTDAFAFITQDTADLDLHVGGNTFPAAGNRNISLAQSGTSVLQITPASVAALAAANPNSTASSSGTITFNSPVSNPPLPTNP